MDGNSNGFECVESEHVKRLHRHDPGENQCSSTIVKRIKAPVQLVINSLLIAISMYFWFLAATDWYVNLSMLRL